MLKKRENCTCICHKGGKIKHFMACCDGGISFEEDIFVKSVKSYSDSEIKEMALEMIFQMTGELVSEDMICSRQGDSNYQIATYYLNKVRQGKNERD